MRQVPDAIYDALNAPEGLMAGARKASHRVTVAPDWWLNWVTTGGQVGSMDKRRLPIRWWQDAADTLEQVEVPNIVSVAINDSPDDPVRSCEIEIDNVKMDPNLSGRNDRLGTRGYYTPGHGTSLEAQARWGQVESQWSELLAENSLLFTWEGYGGHHLTVAEAVAAGHLLKSGVWIVDDWDATATGNLSLKCRCIGSLTVDQKLLPPLVPTALYPLEWFRWKEESKTVNAAAIEKKNTIKFTAGVKRAKFINSSVDEWYPGSVAQGGHLLHGHRGKDAFDKVDGTFWLSEGNSGPNKPFATVWLECESGEAVNAVWVKPWAGNYAAFVSVMEDGRWQGTEVIPYDYTPLIGNQPHVVDQGADIPYVTKVGVPWEQGIEIKLPRVYLAQRVRVTFRNLADSGIGPWRYRAGIRELELRTTTGGELVTGQTTVIPPIYFAVDSLRDPDDRNRQGYVTVSQTGFVDAFGDCRVLRKSGGTGACSHQMTSVALNPAGDGYWTLCERGHVTAYGTAGYHGDASPQNWTATNKAGTILSTPNGEGYWVIGWDGRSFEFGDATGVASASPPPGEIVTSAACSPSGDGLLLLASNGDVLTVGDAVHLGDWTESTLTNTGQQDGKSEIATDIATTFDRDGYWILSSGGRVQAFGAATDLGQMGDVLVPLDAPRDSQAAKDRFYHLLPTALDDGYLITDGDGKIFAFGDVINFGAPIAGTSATIRSTGNYTDYAQIVKALLLWSGWWLFPELDEKGEPVVFGNIESTGAYSDNPLPLEMFDKRPVVDPIKEFADLVGYVFWFQEDGSPLFASPNLWNWGNFLEDGSHTNEVFELDERWNLFDLTMSGTRKYDRSEFIVSTEQPTDALDTTVTTRYVPGDVSKLRGQCRPAMWVNGQLTDPEEQQVMVELTALRMWMRKRLARLTGMSHPGVQKNDQIRILEETTGTTQTWYVLSKNTRFDRESGQSTMDLACMYMGDRDEWAVTAGTASTTIGTRTFRLSGLMLEFLNKRGVELEGLRPVELTQYRPLTAPSDEQGAAT